MTRYAPYSEDPSKEKAGEYKLYAICTHTGPVTDGHYDGQIKDIESGEWFHCNDSISAGIYGKEISSSSAYLLFYS